MKIEHIGIVVESIENARLYYENVLGLKAKTEIIDEPNQNVRVFFLYGDADNSGDTALELIEPKSDLSPVYKFLKEKGGGLHHICYSVDNIESAISDLKSKKCFMIGKIYPGAGHNGKQACWLYTPAKEIIELIEN